MATGPSIRCHWLSPAPQRGPLSGHTQKQAEDLSVDPGDPTLRNFVPPIPLEKTDDGWRIMALR
jgi:hypothetical protein